MERREVLEQAATAITVDRAATHGRAESNFELIANYWSHHLDAEVAPSDVGVMMALLKLARAKSNPTHMDNWIDGCGYLAISAEVAK